MENPRIVNRAAMILLGSLALLLAVVAWATTANRAHDDPRAAVSGPPGHDGPRASDQVAPVVARSPLPPSAVTQSDTSNDADAVEAASRNEEGYGIYGVVHAPAGVDADALAILLVPTGEDQEPLFVTRLQDHRFAFEHVPPSRYWIVCRGLAAIPTRVRVDLDAGGDRNVVVDVRGSPPRTGRVVDGSGGPIAGAEVSAVLDAATYERYVAQVKPGSVIARAEAIWVAEQIADAPRIATTDESGRFTIHGTPELPLRLTIQHEGFAPRDIVVAADERSVTVRLDRR